MNIFARSATQQDLDVLIVLESEARSSLTDFRGGDRLAIAVPEIGPNWSATLIDESVYVLVGGIDLVVMGFMLVRITNRLPTVEQVFVTRDVRNLGVGDALVAQALTWAKQNNFVALDALALPGDRETKNLYERSGLVARLITVTKKLN